MKRILYIVFCVILALCFVMSVSAEAVATEDTTVEDVSGSDNVPTVDDSTSQGSGNAITEETVKETGEAIYNTIFTRIFEFFEINKETIIMVFGFAGTIFITIRDIRRKIRVDNDSGATQQKILSDIGGMINSQNGVVDVVNGLTNSYDEMRRKYTAYEDVEDDRNKLVGAVLVQNAAILDILSSVYVNANLPQGVKDIVQLKYAHCQTALNNDDQLRACVNAVHAALDAKENNADTEEA